MRRPGSDKPAPSAPNSRAETLQQGHWRRAIALPCRGGELNVYIARFLRQFDARGAPGRKGARQGKGRVEPRHNARFWVAACLPLYAFARKDRTVSGLVDRRSRFDTQHAYPGLRLSKVLS